MGYRKTIEKLSKQERESMENDLLKSNMTYHNIALKYECYDDVVTKVATDMGLLQQQDTTPHRIHTYSNPRIGNVPVRKAPATPSLTPAAIVPVAEKNQKKATTRKLPVKLSPDKRTELGLDLLTYQEKSWKGFNRQKLAKKYSITANTLANIANELNIELPHRVTSDKVIFKDGRSIIFNGGKAAASTPPVEEPIEEKKEEEMPVDNGVVFARLTDKELINLGDKVGANIISVKIDDSININKINLSIFSKEISKLKATDDVETPIKNFFESVAGKTNFIKVYFRPVEPDCRIITNLTKYALQYKCNLYVYKGSTEVILLDEYEKLNKNFQNIITKSGGKFLYNTTYETVSNQDTIFIVNIVDGPARRFIVTDTYDKALECAIRAEKKYESNHDTHAIYVQKMNNGNEFTYFTIKN